MYICYPCDWTRARVISLSRNAVGIAVVEESKCDQSGCLPHTCVLVFFCHSKNYSCPCQHDTHYILCNVRRFVLYTTIMSRTKSANTRSSLNLYPTLRWYQVIVSSEAAVDRYGSNNTCWTISLRRKFSIDVQPKLLACISLRMSGTTTLIGFAKKYSRSL